MTAASTHRRVGFSTKIDADLMARLRATVFGMQHLDPTLTICTLTETAAVALCESFERDHRDGQQWPRRDSLRRGGRFAAGTNRVMFSTQLDADVLARLRATVFGMQHVDPSLTICTFTETALEALCVALEQEHHGGRRWAPPPAGPRRGRRPGGLD